MSFRQSFRDILQISQQLSQIGLLLMNLLAHRSAIDKLHGDEVHAVALADFMDGGDVRMIESRCRLRHAHRAWKRCDSGTGWRWGTVLPFVLFYATGADWRKIKVRAGARS